MLKISLLQDPVTQWAFQSAAESLESQLFIEKTVCRPTNIIVMAVMLVDQLVMLPDQIKG